MHPVFSSLGWYSTKIKEGIQKPEQVLLKTKTIYKQIKGKK